MIGCGEALGDAASQAATDSGRALTVDQALAEAEAVLELDRNPDPLARGSPPLGRPAAS